MIFGKNKKEPRKHPVLRRWERLQKQPIELLHFDFHAPEEENIFKNFPTIYTEKSALTRFCNALVFSPDIDPETPNMTQRDREEEYQRISLCKQAQVNLLKDLQDFMNEYRKSQVAALENNHALQMSAQEIRLMGFLSHEQVFGFTGGYAGDNYWATKDNLYGYRGEHSKIDTPSLPADKIFAVNEKLDISALYPKKRNKKDNGIHISVRIG